MKTFFRILIILCCLLSLSASAKAFSNKPTPDEAIVLLKKGNKRFVQGKSTHPNINFSRIRQAGKENQKDHAYTTVITCSDSRVPVELIFDAGIMDIFVIRVAGNVCATDEAGSIEYGMAHVETPVLLVLGHTQCGAVTAVTHAIQGGGHKLEENINPLISTIKPAVKRAMTKHPDIHGDDIIPFGIEENVLESIKNLFLISPTARDLVRAGKVKVVGTIYDVSTGRIRWLPESAVENILIKVEADPSRVMSATQAPAPSHKKTGKHQDVNHEKVLQKLANRPQRGSLTLLKNSELLEAMKTRKNAIKGVKTDLSKEGPSISLTRKILIALIVILIFVGLIFRAKIITKIGIRNELYISFLTTIATTLFVGLCAYYMLYTARMEADIALASMHMDISSNEMHNLQKEFLSTSLEDKESGEKIIKKYLKTNAVYHSSANDILRFDMDHADWQSIKSAQNQSRDYNNTFLNLVAQNSALKALKRELNSLNETLNHKLKATVEKHEGLLAHIETTKRTNPAALPLHTKIVENLIKAEMVSFKISREESEFLLDKDFDRIVELEKQINSLDGTLQTVKTLITSSNSSSLDKKKELEAITEINSLVRDYVKSVSQIIKNQMIFEATLADCRENLKNIKANLIASNSTFLRTRARNIVSTTKSKNTAFFIALIFIYVVGGAYLAFAQTNQIVTPLKKATDVVKKMCQGDFSQQLNLDRNDEIGQLSKALDQLSEKSKGEERRVHVNDHLGGQLIRKAS